ncbi:MAG: sulfatase-like hydrolase/transferase, partial [Muribaculaceae bacterium]|nr:sulfatase-like hydrolase/transferase [Muribaculaceae bacterium]
QAYDNTIEYTDMWLDNLMDMLERSGRMAAVVYSSDHGEDILDDSRGRFLHASPTPTYYQLHVAMLSWVSDAYRDHYSEKYEQLKAHSESAVSSTASLFDTMLDLAGIDTVHSDLKLSLASESYERPEVLYLNDMNKGVDYAHCGLKKADLAIINQKSLL